MQKIKYGSLGFMMLAILAMAMAISAQQPQKAPTPKLVYKRESRPMSAAAGNNLYCAGFIQAAPVNTSLEVVGSDDEAEQRIFVQGDHIYINAGSNQGVKVGDMFSVMRPKGKFSTRLTKKDSLGIYVQEVGGVEVVSVKSQVSVAMIKSSCEGILLGDLLQASAKRVSPSARVAPNLEKFADPSGKAMGRVVLARDGLEFISRDQILYIDLGAEDNVSVGDYLTVFRPLGKGNVLDFYEDESLSARDPGYQSKRYRGGKFSNQAPRKSGEKAGGSIVTTSDAKSRRPDGLRKVVGEIIILNVKEKTATAVVTRNVQEIHPGDMVEVQ